MKCASNVRIFQVAMVQGCNLRAGSNEGGGSLVSYVADVWKSGFAQHLRHGQLARVSV